MEYKHNNRNDFWPRESLNSRRADAIHHISAVINCSVIRVTFNIIFFFFQVINLLALKPKLKLIISIVNFAEGISSTMLSMQNNEIVEMEMVKREFAVRPNQITIYLK